MIDNLSILLSHCLILLAFWLLSQRDDLDVEEPPEPDPEPQGFAARRHGSRPTRRAGPRSKAAPPDA